MTSSDNPAILQVIPALEAGGAERTTIDLAKALTAEGFRALVASTGGRMEPLLESAGGELCRVPLALKTPHRIWQNGRRLALLIHREDAKLIHARSRAPAWSALLAAHATGVPFVTTYHGIYNAANPLKRFYNSVMVKSDAVIANSRWTADHIVREHGIRRGRIAVIPRGIDLEEFDPAGVSPDRIAQVRGEWGTGTGEPVVLLPGRLTRWKGQRVLIEAVEELLRSNPSAQMKVILQGDPQGRDGYVQQLEGAIANKGLQGRVRIVPHVADMPAAYLASDIVVSASTDPEAFGRVAAEAGAMGRPVIATDHGGARETVLIDRSGLLVAPGDPSSLADALRTVLNLSGEERGRMGEAGRAYVREHFSLTRMCESTIALYRALLSESRGG